MKKLISITLIIAWITTMALSQNLSNTASGTLKKTLPDYKCSVNTTWLTFANFGPEKTNTHHYEFHFGYQITLKDKIGIKVATWSLFAPMGIPWGPYIMKESESYPGRIRESGIGITYQRILWKGLFTSIEILPLKKTYLDENKKKMGDGFKLYTSYHLGYHIPLLKNRLFLEPQIHCNYWPVDTKGPQAFEENEIKWSNNYFLFEPNIYIGVNF
jgi:hypothetical protein